jgi:hypothetical protein
VKEYSIGQMSRQTGVKVTTIRYYESRGLIPSPARTEGGHGDMMTPRSNGSLSCAMRGNWGSGSMTSRI